MNDIRFIVQAKMPVVTGMIPRDDPGPEGGPWIGAEA